MKRATFGPEAFEGLVGKLPTQYPRTIGPNAMKYLQEVVDSGLTRKSTMVERFEQAFAKELGVKHCIATPGCNPALSALAAAFPFDPGDEIIVSSITDYGSIHGLIKENFIPVFADTEAGEVNISARTIEPCITDRTRAILCVHKTGIVCDMDPINALAKKHGLIVYEDVCQAVFSQYKGRLAGTLGLAAGFSFDSEKTMGSDLGGCVVTDDDTLAERIRFMGQSRGGVIEPGFGRKHVAPGHAFRMAYCTAALCLAQLEIIRQQVAQRDRMVRLLSRLVAEIPGVKPLTIPDYLDVYSSWMFSFNIDPAQFRCTIEELAKQLADAGIPGAGAGKYYLMPAAVTFLGDNARKKVYPYSMPPASREYRYNAETCPNAWKFVQTWIRWSTFCEKYTEAHCELAARIVSDVAEKNRK
jgi:perosamine synthetase